MTNPSRRTTETMIRHFYALPDHRTVHPANVRVLTLAVQTVGDVVYYGAAICRPPEYRLNKFADGGMLFEQVEGDQWDRKRGVRIATQRCDLARMDPERQNTLWGSMQGVVAADTELRLQQRALYALCASHPKGDVLRMCKGALEVLLQQDFIEEQSKLMREEEAARVAGRDMPAMPAVLSMLLGLGNLGGMDDVPEMPRDGSLLSLFEGERGED